MLANIAPLFDFAGAQIGAVNNALIEVKLKRVQVGGVYPKESLPPGGSALASAEARRLICSLTSVPDR